MTSTSARSVIVIGESITSCGGLPVNTALPGLVKFTCFLKVMVNGSLYDKTVLIVVLAPMSGMASPVLFDLFASFAWPWLRAKLRKKVVVLVVSVVVGGILLDFYLLKTDLESLTQSFDD